MKKLVGIISGVIITFGAFSQDFHFSQFYASPMTLNPALAGAIPFDWRVAGIYRSQWSWSAGDFGGGGGFRTFGASFDMPLLRGKLADESDYVGVGAYFFKDESGDGAFGPTEISGFVSYSKSIGTRRAPMAIAGGIQATYTQFSVETQDLYFEDQYTANPQLWNGSYESLPASSSLDHGLFSGNNLSGFDLSTGAFWFYSSSAKVGLTGLQAGGAVSHLLRPVVGFIDASAKLNTKVTFHSNAIITFNDQVSLLPSLIWLSQGPASEFNIGTTAKFAVGEVGGNALHWFIGAWVRTVGDLDKALATDALILVTRFDIGRFDIGYSFDMTMSQLADAENTGGTRAGINGAHEISFSYMGKLPGSHTSTGTVLCPRF